MQPESQTIWFTTRGRIVIPQRLRRAFQIKAGTRAVIAVTPEGILIKPVTRHAIRRAHGILQRPPGEKSFAEEWAEHKREELRLEEQECARGTGEG